MRRVRPLLWVTVLVAVLAIPTAGAGGVSDIGGRVSPAGGQPARLRGPTTRGAAEWPDPGRPKKATDLWASVEECPQSDGGTAVGAA